MDRWQFLIGFQQLEAAPRCPDWGTKLQDFCEAFWTWLDNHVADSQIVDRFITLLRQPACFELAQLVIPELRDHQDLRLDNQHKRRILDMISDMCIEATRLESLTQADFDEPFYAAEKKLHAESELVRKQNINHSGVGSDSVALSSSIRPLRSLAITSSKSLTNRTVKATKFFMHSPPSSIKGAPDRLNWPSTPPDLQKPWHGRHRLPERLHRGLMSPVQPRLDLPPMSAKSSKRRLPSQPITESYKKTKTKGTRIKGRQASSSSPTSEVYIKSEGQGNEIGKDPDSPPLTLASILPPRRVIPYPKPTSSPADHHERTPSPARDWIPGEGMPPRRTLNFARRDERGAPHTEQKFAEAFHKADALVIDLGTVVRDLAKNLRLDSITDHSPAYVERFIYYKTAFEQASEMLQVVTGKYNRFLEAGDRYGELGKWTKDVAEDPPRGRRRHQPAQTLPEDGRISPINHKAWLTESKDPIVSPRQVTSDDETESEDGDSGHQPFSS
ncbi:hypothetical protein D6D12_02719 [Aureobasidium pullulans]|uniref:Uncharacterized protein n=1 Tax=Aureobasidium pullulans TaxID=5580 RepID=A0AB74K0J5_AURPU|nr:hypothetical protein D6D12_02719 [Aureobasidium pullulans]